MKQHKLSWEQIAGRWVLWIGCTALASAFVISLYGGYLDGWKWVGLVKNADFHKRTLWDWLDLLIVPVVLAIAGYWFTRSENRSTQASTEQRAQEEALQAYLDQIGHLLLEKGLRNSEDNPEDGSEVRTLARARTLTVLRRLDDGRKRNVVQFLYESHLISKGHPVVDLSMADLREANLVGARLRGADLSNTDLGEANLEHASLFEADLSSANLANARLEGAYLTEATLVAAKLTRADLKGARLSMSYDPGATGGGNEWDSVGDESSVTDETQSVEDHSDNRRGADLTSARLEGADLTSARLDHTVLEYANLTGAVLNEARLTHAHMQGVNLTSANLRRADLHGANLSGADLTGASVTREQLVNANTLEGATMPNGKKYEDWLKDKKAQGKDEKNE